MEVPIKLFKQGFGSNWKNLNEGMKEDWISLGVGLIIKKWRHSRGWEYDMYMRMVIDKAWKRKTWLMKRSKK